MTNDHWTNPTLCLTEEWTIRRMPPCCDRFDPGTGSQADGLPGMGGTAWLRRITPALNND